MSFYKLERRGHIKNSSGYQLCNVDGNAAVAAGVRSEPETLNPTPYTEREFIEYKTSMITDEDPLRGLLIYQDLGFSHTLHQNA